MCHDYGVSVTISGDLSVGEVVLVIVTTVVIVGVGDSLMLICVSCIGVIVGYVDSCDELASGDFRGSSNCNMSTKSLGGWTNVPILP